LSPVIVDGNDVMTVREVALSAVAAIREGRGPAFIECKTVRWERHSAFSSGRYANPEEAQKWRTVDPIPRFAASLKAQGVTEERLARVRDQATAIIVAAAEF